MELTADQEKALVRGDRAKDFLASSFWTEDLSPGLMTQLAVDLPNPDHKDWEQQYVAFWALSNATKQLINLCESWVAEAERIRKIAGATEESITES